MEFESHDHQPIPPITANLEYIIMAYEFDRK